jgi:hypothetical protein
MAEVKEQLKEVTLYNQGPRTFHTQSGVLAPLHSLTVPESEAKDLLGYPEVIDLAKMSPKQSETIDTLRAENARLKVEIEKLKGAENVKESKPESRKK